MRKMITNKTIAKNLATSVFVQVLSLGVSFLLNVFVPRGIDEYQYSYWQTFVLYLGYVGVLHFGLLDGIVLRYSQYDYGELERTIFHTLFMFLLGSTSFLAMALIVASCLFATDTTRLIIILVSIGIILRNIFTYNSYLFQITNRIHGYAKLIVIQRLIYGLLVIGLLLLGVNDFYWYCIAELIGDAASIIVGAVYNRGMYFGKLMPVKKAFLEWKINVAAGVKLMLANWSSILLLSGAKMVVQWRWDELVFGKVAFSFSVCNLFLTLVVAVGVVLFPILKRIDQEQMSGMYKSIREIISPLLLVALVCYYPACYLIQIILPKYSQSLQYLGVLFPMIVFTSKVNLLTNNYLKAYRKEKQMLIINAASIALAFLMFGIGAYVLNSITAVLVGVVLSSMFNSVVSEITVMRKLQIHMVKEIVIEIIVAVAFIVATLNLNLMQAALVYICILAVYAIIFRRNIMRYMKILFHKFRMGTR